LKLYKQVKVPGFQPGISKPSMFDPIVHIEISEVKHTEEGDEEGDEED